MSRPRPVALWFAGVAEPPMNPDEEFPADASPPVHLRARLLGKSLVLSLTDRTIFEPGKVDALRREIQHAIQAHPAAIYVIDMEPVEFISSSFLAALLKMSMSFRERALPFRLCRLKPELTRVLQATKLDRALDVRIDLDDALSPI